MSGMDPLAAITAQVAAAEAAMLEAAINLGVSADVLQAQISIGDIVAAKILPPQNGQDLIEILGQRVAAQLPPGVHPGETLLLQVTGFAGTQIYVRNLGTPDPRNPLPVTDVVLSAPQSETPPSETSPSETLPNATSQSAVLSTIREGDASAPPPVSPPRAVFVAASVRQAPPTQTQQAQQTPIAASRVIVEGVEARIAAAQAAKLPPVVTVRAQNAATQTTASKPPAAPAAPARPATSTTPLIPARGASVQGAMPNVVQRAVQTVSEFLRAARLPDTPFTRMAATIAPHAPERLPSVLQRLEATLPRVTEDSRISTLRTLIGFTARLNPANAETLRAQISAYVSNVIEGVEAKLGQLLQAHTQTAAHAAPLQPRAQSTQTQTQTQTPQGQTAQTPDDSQALTPTLAQARVAERSAAISHDLKSVVLSLLRDPPATRTTAMAQALSETLITLTGAQVNALSSTQQNPGTFNFTLPVYYHEGGKPAQLRISRDAESRAAKMDADNFHVAFVLDTANLGTVAIDLQTSGRTVKLDVKTENKPAAERFADSLSSLRTRLEDLRYRVSSAAASALPSTAAPAKSAAGANGVTRIEKKRGLDLQA